MTKQAALNKLHTPGFAELCAHCGLRLVVLLDPSAKGLAAPSSNINLAVLPTADLKGSGGGDCVVRFEVDRNGRPVFEARPGEFGDFCSLAVRQHEDFLLRMARLTRDSAAKGGV